MRSALQPAMLIVLLPLVLCLPFSLQYPLRITSTSSTLNPYPDKPRLTFRKATGTFKITVFSDLHFGENPWDVWGPEQDRNSTRLMNRVLPEENPDYVVLNGDLITGENTFKENATSLIDEIVAPINAVGVPFSSTHGNHDNQVNITHLAEIQREQKVAPLSYTRVAPNGVGGVGGPGNYWVPVYENVQSISPKLILWFFDSRGGVMIDGSKMPDWVDPSVATWLASETKTMNEAWGSMDTRQNLVFVHIPPFAIQALQANLSTSKNPGLNADLLAGDGSVQSTFPPVTQACSTECDEPFWNSLFQNLGSQNIVAIVSGHDHGNEWCAKEPVKKVVFCFDKHSGYGGYSSAGWNYGVRNFVFSAKSKTVESWVRYEEGDVKAKVKLSSGTITIEG